ITTTNSPPSATRASMPLGARLHLANPYQQIAAIRIGKCDNSGKQLIAPIFLDPAPFRRRWIAPRITILAVLVWNARLEVELLVFEPVADESFQVPLDDVSQ